MTTEPGSFFPISLSARPPAQTPTSVTTTTAIASVIGEGDHHHNNASVIKLPTVPGAIGAYPDPASVAIASAIRSRIEEVLAFSYPSSKIENPKSKIGKLSAFSPQLSKIPPHPRRCLRQQTRGSAWGHPCKGLASAKPIGAKSKIGLLQLVPDQLDWITEIPFAFNIALDFRCIPAGGSCGNSAQ